MLAREGVIVTREMGYGIREHSWLVLEDGLGYGRVGTTGKKLKMYTILIVNIASERAAAGNLSSYLFAEKC